MRFGIILFFAAIPAAALALLALVPLLLGLSRILDLPTLGSLFVAWAAAGIFGCVTLWRVVRGRSDPNMTLGLLAGIVAASPVAVWALTYNGYPEALFWGYWTLGPILVAMWLLIEKHFLR